jgi:hypothetical protein
MKIKHDADYRQKRVAEYPDIGDQLDAIWKQLGQLPLLVSETEIMLNRVKEIKQRYPKP